MEIKRVGSQASLAGPAERFTGTVRIAPLFIEANAPSRAIGTSFTFEPGVQRRQFKGLREIASPFVFPAPRVSSKTSGLMEAEHAGR